MCTSAPLYLSQLPALNHLFICTIISVEPHTCSTTCTITSAEPQYLSSKSYLLLLTSAPPYLHICTSAPLYFCTTVLLHYCTLSPASSEPLHVLCTCFAPPLYLYHRQCTTCSAPQEQSPTTCTVTSAEPLHLLSSTTAKPLHMCTSAPLCTSISAPLHLCILASLHLTPAQMHHLSKPLHHQCEMKSLHVHISALLLL